MLTGQKNTVFYYNGLVIDKKNSVWHLDIYFHFFQSFKKIFLLAYLPVELGKKLFSTLKF